MLLEWIHNPEGVGDPAMWWLMVISMLREDAPWLYESGMEVHRAIKQRDPRKISEALEDFERSMHVLRRTEMGHYMIDSPEIDMLTHELPHIARDFLCHDRRLQTPVPPKKKDTTKEN
jgi:hypothetical protein